MRNKKNTPAVFFLAIALFFFACYNPDKYKQQINRLQQCLTTIHQTDSLSKIQNTDSLNSIIKSETEKLLTVIDTILPDTVAQSSLVDKILLFDSVPQYYNRLNDTLAYYTAKLQESAKTINQLINDLQKQLIEEPDANKFTDTETATVDNIVKSISIVLQNKDDTFKLFELLQIELKNELNLLSAINQRTK
jgi:hypothetical protein